MKRKPAPRITMTELVAGLGEKRALWLIKNHSGQVLPRLAQVLRQRRDTQIVQDWLDGAGESELTARYHMTKKALTRVLDRYRRRYRHLCVETGTNQSGG